jgi:hypothetical protein
MKRADVFKSVKTFYFEGKIYVIFDSVNDR